jgi:hypothetical protein
MFYWKSAIVLLGLLAFATVIMLETARSNWERAAIAKLAMVAALITCISLSFVSLMLSQLLFGLLLLMCVDRRMPIVGTYCFLGCWTLAAAPHLAIGGAYFAPVRPTLTMAIAMLVGWLLNPDIRLARRLNRSDIYLILFFLAFWICVSLRDSSTGSARNFVNYVIAYALTYFVVSRSRIERPELWLKLLVFAGAATGAVCIFETIRGWPLYAGIAPLKGLFMMVDYGGTMLQRSGLVRASGPYVHPLVASMMLGMISIAAYALTLIYGLRTSVIIVGLLCLGGTIATVSRTGLAGLAAGLVLMQLLRGRYAVMFGLLVVGVVAVVALSDFSGADGSSTTAYRLTLMAGLPAKLGYHIILGYREAISLGILDEFLQGQGIVDLVNIYLGIAVLGGLVSLVPFLMFLGSSFFIYRKVVRMKPSREQLIVAQTCVCIQFAYLVEGFGAGAWGMPMLLSLICVAVLVAIRAEIEQAARRHRRAAAVAAPVAAAVDPADPFPLPAIR